MTGLSAIQVLILVATAAPLGLLALLGASSLLGRPLPERVTGILAPVSFFLCLGSLGMAGALMYSQGIERETLALGKLLAVGEQEFQLRLLVDPLSVTFAIFAETLCGVVAAFAHRYLHRENGYNRFFLLLATFSAGMMFIILAGSLEVLFAGWEFVGVSSALLIAFFHDRPTPARNGLWTFIVYRVTDIGMLGAAVLIHHSAGSGLFDDFLGTAWPGGVTSLTGAQATGACFFLLFSAMGKCALLPFSGWLPRAMEGPTPSSAIFYGALSVHAGAYLLLRMSPLFDRSPLASSAVVLTGMLTAIFATLVGRVQSDVKTALAYASMTQVGIIIAEIGLGFRWLALLHMVGHASLRSLQLLRSPSLLHDFHDAEAAVGGHLAHTGMHLERMFPERAKWRLYRFALEKGYIDSILDRFVVVPFVRAVRTLDGFEERWCRLLGGAKKRARAESEASS
ncbi:MAG: oxidoreductase [Acidobacteria bacterium]|nr:oxidoreductase [Acidobacteriota bacterium]MCK6681984.1 oxidoreductase [Thermoanaerobaculia bacterium]